MGLRCQKSFWVVMSLFAHCALLSAADGAATDPFAPSQMPQTTVPNFNVPAGFSNIFAGCASTPVPQCSSTIPESAAGPVENCDVDMTTIYGTAAQQAAQAGQVMANLQCKANAIVGFRNEISCVNSAAQSLANLLGSLQGIYAQNIHAMQKNVKQLISIEKDREAQLIDTQLKLNGNEKTGQKGINQMSEAAQAALAKMPDDIQGIKEGYLDLDNKKSGLEEAVKLRKTALAVECFSTDKSPTYISSKGGTAETALTYAVSMYKNKLMEGAGGIADQSKFRQVDAEAKGKQLEAALQQWLSKLPNDPKITLPPSIGAQGKDGAPADPTTALSGFFNQNRTLITPDLLKQLEASLQSFDGKGLSISKFVVSTMQTCYSNNSKKVEQERTSKSTQLGVLQEGIKQQERIIRTNVSKLMNGYSALIQDSMSALTGENMPINTSNCTAPNQTAKGQMQCLDDSLKNVKGLVEGSISQSVVNMVIKGNNPSSNIGLQCAGLKGCAQKLKNLATNVEAERQRVKEFKESYVLQSNQAIETFTKQVASQLSPQMAALQQRLATMNLIVGGLGVKSLVEPAGVDGESLDKEGEELAGLYKVPKSTLALIGGQMSPPMMDLSKNPFNTVITGMTERLSEISKAQADVAKVITEINQIPAKCLAQKEKERKEEEKERLAAAKEAREADLDRLFKQKMIGEQGGGVSTSSVGDGGSDRDCDTARSRLQSLSDEIIAIQDQTERTRRKERDLSPIYAEIGRACGGAAGNLTGSAQTSNFPAPITAGLTKSGMAGGSPTAGSFGGFGK